MADKKTFVRVWTAFDPVEVKKHLLLIDDLYGSCANCKQLGLNYLKDKECPGCKTVFKYVTTNLKGMDDVKKNSRKNPRNESKSYLDRKRRLCARYSKRCCQRSF